MASPPFQNLEWAGPDALVIDLEAEEEKKQLIPQSHEAANRHGQDDVHNERSEQNSIGSDDDVNGAVTASLEACSGPMAAAMAVPEDVLVAAGAPVPVFRGDSPYQVVQDDGEDTKMQTVEAVQGICLEATESYLLSHVRNWRARGGRANAAKRKTNAAKRKANGRVTKSSDHSPGAASDRRSLANGTRNKPLIIDSDTDSDGENSSQKNNNQRRPSSEALSPALTPSSPTSSNSDNSTATNDDDDGGNNNTATDSISVQLSIAPTGSLLRNAGGICTLFWAHAQEVRELVPGAEMDAITQMGEVLRWADAVAFGAGPDWKNEDGAEQRVREAGRRLCRLLGCHRGAEAIHDMVASAPSEAEINVDEVIINVEEDEVKIKMEGEDVIIKVEEEDEVIINLEEEEVNIKMEEEEEVKIKMEKEDE